MLSERRRPWLYFSVVVEPLKGMTLSYQPLMWQEIWKTGRKTASCRPCRSSMVYLQNFWSFYWTQMAFNWIRGPFRAFTILPSIVWERTLTDKKKISFASVEKPWFVWAEALGNRSRLTRKKPVELHNFYFIRTTKIIFDLKKKLIFCPTLIWSIWCNFSENLFQANFKLPTSYRYICICMYMLLYTFLDGYSQND